MAELATPRLDMCQTQQQTAGVNASASIGILMLFGEQIS